jgi:hypothetical protein
LSDSPYGTFDQGGNVGEWTEEVALPFNDSRVVRGGSYYGSRLIVDSPIASEGGNATDFGGYEMVGFRVAHIPEPSALLLAALAGAGFAARRRTSRHDSKPSVLSARAAPRNHIPRASAKASP